MSITYSQAIAQLTTLTENGRIATQQKNGVGHDYFYYPAVTCWAMLTGWVRMFKLRININRSGANRGRGFLGYQAMGQ